MSNETFEIVGWVIYAHLLFVDQLEAMIDAGETARKSGCVMRLRSYDVPSLFRAVHRIA